MEYLEPWIPHLAALGGLLTGIMITWFVGRGSLGTVRARHDERSKAAERSIADLEAGCANLEAEVRQLRHTEAVSLKRQAELEVLAKTQAKSVEEKQALLREAEGLLANHFKDLSTATLRATQEEFLRLARSTFDQQQRVATSELEQRRVAVETLVRPVAATLNKVESRIGELEQARKDSEATLSEQVRQMAAAQLSLQKETAQLTRALHQPVGRGRWGEIQLKRVVELSGMAAHCDFIETGIAPEGDGPPRPDLIINLPTGRQIAVDARAPLEAGLTACEATDEATREAALKDHARRIADHLSELASGPYRAQFLQAPEFVVLFLPGESFFSAALAEDPTLMERGIEKGVILATPATLVALLRAAAAGWRQEGIAEKARHVSEVGRELYSRVISLADHVARIGHSLDTTVQNYNLAIGSLEGDVLPSARKLSDLGIVPPAKELPVSPLVERSVRQPRLDLSRLPLSGAPAPASTMSSMVATGELPDDTFEGFAVPAVKPASPLPAPPKTIAARESNGTTKSGQAGNPERAPHTQPNAEGAAGDLRAALVPQKKAV
jgi:DNA recombination protein RmuC